MPPAIAASGLTKHYPDHPAVDDLDLEVAPGSIACLLGPNGSGKSTTVAMLTTLRRPTRGSARVAGFDVTTQAPAVRARCGVALQRTGLDTSMCGRALLEFQGRLHGLDRRATRRRAAALLVEGGLAEHADRPVRALSGGLRRRLDLALALMHRPAVLVLDEPTTGLDPVSRRALWAEVHRLSAEGTTVLLTTQLLDEADALADMICVLHRGRALQTTTPQALKHRLGRWTLTLRLADPSHTAQAAALLERGRHLDVCTDGSLRLRVDRNEPASLVSLLARHNLDVVGMQVDEPSLEDVYLRLLEDADTTQPA